MVAAKRHTFQLGFAASYRVLFHLAFVAQNREQVDNFYRAALEAGVKDNGAAGEYSGTYYAAFVIGPDGHNIEVVFHEA